MSNYDWSKCFVQIVESPAPQDLFAGRTEGRMLAEALRLADVKHRYRLVANLATFRQALSEDLGDAVRCGLGLPLVRISAHGDENGIGLTDGTVLSWESLREIILPVNRAGGVV